MTTAWLAPLPPRSSAAPRATTVSPGRGKQSSRITVSTAALPTTWIMPRRPGLARTDEPLERLSPEPGISRPGREFRGQPMRADVRGPGERAALAEASGDEQRSFAVLRRHRGDDRRTGLRLDLVEAEQRRPDAFEAGEDGVRVQLDCRREAFGHFDAVVIGQDVDRQRVLDRRA